MGIKAVTGDENGEAGGESSQISQQDVMVPWVLHATAPGAGKKGEDQVFYRYYHLFKKGELEELVRDAAKEDGYMILDGEETLQESKRSGKWMRIADQGYEKDNWWLQGEVGCA